MTHTDNYLTAGNLVTFTSGEYSDYSMHGTFVALETVTWAAAKELADRLIAKEKKACGEIDWLNANTQDVIALDVGNLQENFQVALVRKGWLLEVKSTERHLGYHGELELE